MGGCAPERQAFGGRLCRAGAGGTDLIHLLKTAKHAEAPLIAVSLAAQDDDVIFSRAGPLAIGGIETKVAAALADIGRQLPEGRTVAIQIRRGDDVIDIINQSAEDVAANRHQKAVATFLMRFVPPGVYASYLWENRFDGDRSV